MSAPNSVPHPDPRHRTRVLAAARREFAEHGTALTVQQVARRAGVAVHTVHRTFSGKDTLIEAVLVAHTDELVGLVRQRFDDPDPGPAFFATLDEVVTRVARYRHLCGAFVADRSWPRAGIAAAALRFDAALDRLLQAARARGAVRPDVALADVHALVVGASAMQATGPRARPLVERVLGTIATDPVAVTKPAAFRDGGAAASRCAECGTTLRPSAVGRPARYCGPRCRQRARRRRAAAMNW